ncbi:MAG: hypothetical protein IJ524_00425 [Bacteroidales bacterium]|nr:hypothetical protein [Bacteroidales bacterium]
MISFIHLPLLLLPIALTSPTHGQTANGYIIYYSGHFLSHNASTGAVVTAGTTTFDPATCLWSVPTTTTIRPVGSDGSTVLGNLYLRPRSGNSTYSLNTNASTNYNGWTSGLTDGGHPTYSTNRYLRWSGSSSVFQVSTTNSAQAFLYAVTKSTDVANVPESYNGSLSGATAFFTAGATATYTPTVTHTAAYNLTIATYSYSGGTLGSESTGIIPPPNRRQSR